MEWLGWCILIAYILGYAGFAPLLTRAIYTTIHYGFDEDVKVDKIVSSIIGMIFALFWPLVIPVGYIYRKAFKTKEN